MNFRYRSSRMATSTPIRGGIIMQLNKDIFHCTVYDFTNGDVVSAEEFECEKQLEIKVRDLFDPVKHVSLFHLCENFSSVILNAVKASEKPFFKCSLIHCLLLNSIMDFPQKNDSILKVVARENGIDIFQMKKTESGSQAVIRQQSYGFAFLLENENEILNIICGQTNKCQIHVYFVQVSSQRIKTYRKLLKCKKATFVESKFTVPSSCVRISAEKIKALLCETDPCFGIVTAKFNYQLMIKIGDCHKIVLAVEKGDLLNIEKEAVIDGIFMEHLYMTSVNGELEKVQPPGIKSTCKVVLTIDDKNCPQLRFDDSKEKEILNLALKFANKCVSRDFPLFVFRGNTSYILLPEEDGYRFFDDWNGENGRPSVIAFDIQNRVTLHCEDAVRFLNSEPSDVVYDILQLMTKSWDALEKNSCWDTEVLKYGEETVKFMKIAGVPEKMMQSLILSHTRAIKRRFKTRPEQIGILILDNFGPEERHKLHEKFTQACKRIGSECKYVEFFHVPSSRLHT